VVRFPTCRAGRKSSRRRICRNSGARPCRPAAPALSSPRLGVLIRRERTLSPRKATLCERGGSLPRPPLSTPLRRPHLRAGRSAMMARGMSGSARHPRASTLRRELCSNSCCTASERLPYGTIRGNVVSGANHPSSPQRSLQASHQAGAPRRPSGKSLQAQGRTPCAPRAGLCGRLTAGQTYQKPPGVPPSWGSRQRPNLLGGPPLGALRRCVWARARALSLLPTALWGIQKGEADVQRGSPGPKARLEVARTVGLTAPDPVTRELFCPSRGSWPHPGAR
jgi:hypothetical protein